MSNREPYIKVGVLRAAQIRFNLTGNYLVNGKTVSGEFCAEAVSDHVLKWCGEEYETLTFKATSEECTFTLYDVVIGVNFHWERKENQRFQGDLTFLFELGELTAVNELSVEKYLASVISSEMSAKASLELLKAHAVISRSWLLAQIEKQNQLSTEGKRYSATTATDVELIKWYDREDHINFHVCADDHCQRYQGVTRQTTPTVAEAVEQTKGQVLTADGKICDARFSKCCGGVLEEFQYCWEPRRFDYLKAKRDSLDVKDFPNLSLDANAAEWINSRPDAYCNTCDAEILAQVLNNYDQETKDFYRWTVTYEREELANLVRNRSGIDFGYIKDLIPLSRGTSGRIWRLAIVGTKKVMIIGKELEIRRTLSPSHLYSSAFTVERHDIDPNTSVPARITLHGAGWGHGVGLCQIGAAVMGARGYSYDTILSHYFPGSQITQLY